MAAGQEWIPLPPMDSPPNLPGFPGSAPTAPPSGPDPADPKATKAGGEALFWTIVLWLDFAYLIVNAAVGLYLLLRPDSDLARRVVEQAGSSTRNSLYLDVALTFVAFAVIPFLWVRRTRLGGWPATKEYFRLHRPARSLALGAAAGLGLILALAVLLSVARAIVGHDLVDSPGPHPTTDALQANLDWGLALFVALAAGIGEELLFRGVLLRQTGLVAQAVLFAVAHASNASPLQMGVTLVMGFAFGWWLRRGGSLYTTIAAHAIYDLGLLSIALAARDHPEWTNQTAWLAWPL